MYSWPGVVFSLFTPLKVAKILDTYRKVGRITLAFLRPCLASGITLKVVGEHFTCLPSWNLDVLSQSLSC